MTRHQLLYHRIDALGVFMREIQGALDAAGYKFPIGEMDESMQATFYTLRKATEDFRALVLLRAFDEDELQWTGNL